jgi:hypothetical protein
MEKPVQNKKILISIGVGAGLILLGIIYQVMSLKDQQQQLALENARLAGMTEAHSKTLASHETRMNETSKRVEAAETRVTEVAATVEQQGIQIAANTQQIEQQGKDISAVRRQVRTLQDSPSTNVVVAATDDAAKQEAFNNWAANHPDWKKRRSCMRDQMNRNPSISLTDAYNACG